MDWSASRRIAVKHFRKRRVEVKGIDDIWAADLVDMQSFAKYNDGIKYLLTVIDVFSSMVGLFY